MDNFQEVMRQWTRMCAKYVGDGNCKDCPLVSNDVCGEIYSATDEDIRRALATITAWAAANPEPVYPTWREWLIEQGVIQMVESVRHDSLIPSMMLSVDDPIPADIAQKLGIEPKK